MKKSLSLLMSIILIFTVIGAVPIVSAEEIEYTPVAEEFAKEHWNYPANLYDFVKVDNWYYAIWKNSKEGINPAFVCGYDGNDTAITIPTKLGEKVIFTINEFYLFSNTVETINIPKTITDILPSNSEEKGNYCFRWDIDCSLKKIVVDSENAYYKSMDGVLFSKDGKYLYRYPAAKKAEEYVVPSEVQYICSGAFTGVEKLKSLTITPGVVNMFYNSIPEDGLEELYFKNTILPFYELAGEPPYSYDKTYIPDVDNTVVYCIENSEMYKLYKQSSGVKCKELKVLPPLTETLKKEVDGKWYYYIDEYKVKDNTLVKFKDKWFYVTNDVWDKTVTNKLVNYKGKRFYIKNGKWDKTANGFFKINNEWQYVKNGKQEGPIEDLVKYNGKWFYIIDGRWYGGKNDYTYVAVTDSKNPHLSYMKEFHCSNTLFKKNGKWLAIKNGKWYKGKAIIKYSGKKFYVNKGFVQFKYSGKVKIDGKTYKIKNGKVA